MDKFETGQLLKVTKFYSSSDGDPLDGFYPVYACVLSILGAGGDTGSCKVGWISPNLPDARNGSHYHGPDELAQVDHVDDSGVDVYEIIDVSELPDDCCPRLAMLQLGVLNDDS
jgi:hypothetical protein